MNVFTLFARVVANRQEYRRQMRGMEGDTRTAAGRMAGYLGGVRKALGVLVGLGGLVAAGMLKLAGSAEKAEATFKGLLGTAEAAVEMLGKLRDFSAKTPLRFEEVRNAGQMLLAFGTAAGDVVPTLQRLGDVAAGTNNRLSEIAEIYGKARVQGRLFAEDINQLTGRGIPIIGALADVLGVAESQVKALVSEGKVGFPELEQAFVKLTEEGSKFGGMMEEQAKTLPGLFSTALDLLTQTATTLSTKFVDAFNVKGGLQKLIDQLYVLRERVENFDLEATLEGWQTALGDFAERWRTGLEMATLAIATRLVPAVGLLVTATKTGINAIKLKVRALMASIGPIGWVILAVEALYLAYKSNFGGMRDLVHGWVTNLRALFYRAQRVLGVHGEDLERLKRRWKTAVDRGKVLWGDLTKRLKKLFFELSDTTKRRAAEMTRWLKGHGVDAGKIWDQIQTHVLKAVRFIGSLLANLPLLFIALIDNQELVGRSIKRIWQGVMTMFSGVRLLLFGYVVEPFQKLVEPIVSAAAEVSGVVERWVNQLAEKFEPFTRWLASWGVSVGQSMAKGAKSGMKALSTELTAGLEEQRTNLKEFSEDSESVQEGYRLIGMGASAVTNAWGDAVNGLSKSMTEIARDIDTVETSARGYAAATEEVSTQTQEVTDTLEGETVPALESTETALSDTGAAAGEAAGEVKTLREELDELLGLTERYASGMLLDYQVGVKDLKDPRQTGADKAELLWQQDKLGRQVAELAADGIQGDEYEQVLNLLARINALKEAYNTLSEQALAAQAPMLQASQERYETEQREMEDVKRAARNYYRERSRDEEALAAAQEARAEQERRTAELAEQGAEAGRRITDSMNASTRAGERDAAAREVLNEATEKYLGLTGQAPSAIDTYVKGLERLKIKYPQVAEALGELIDKLKEFEESSTPKVGSLDYLRNELRDARKDFSAAVTVVDQDAAWARIEALEARIENITGRYEDPEKKKSGAEVAVEQRQEAVDALTTIAAADSALMQFGKRLLGSALAEVPAFGAALQGFVTGGPLGALAGMFSALVGESEAFKGIMSAVNGLLKPFIDALTGLLDGIWPLIDLFLQLVDAGLKPLLFVIEKVITPVFTFVARLIAGIYNAVASAINAILGWLGVHLNLIDLSAKAPREGEGGDVSSERRTVTGGAFGEQADPDYNASILLNSGQAKVGAYITAPLAAVADMFSQSGAMHLEGGQRILDAATMLDARLERLETLNLNFDSANALGG